jgi:hypothetical protein
MNNAGYSFNFDNLQELIQNTPAIESMISNYNKDHIVLGKESIANKEPDEAEVEKQSSTVDNMASKASKF